MDGKFGIGQNNVAQKNNCVTQKMKAHLFDLAVSFNCDIMSLDSF